MIVQIPVGAAVQQQRREREGERETEGERGMHRQSSRTQITVQRIGGRLRKRSAERQGDPLGRMTAIALGLYVDRL